MMHKPIDDLDQEILTDVSKIYKALSERTRIRILYLLSQKECAVSEIAETLGLEQSAVSHQLSFLKKIRLVKSRRSGKTIYYSEDDEHVMNLLNQTIRHARHGYPNGN